MVATTFVSGIILVSCAENEPKQQAVTNPSTILTAEQTTVRLGDPVTITLTLTNHSQTNIEADANGIVFDCFEIKGPAGQRLTYVGFDGQIGYMSKSIAATSSRVMAEHLDLTDSYVFPKPGRYSIRYRNIGPGWYPDSDKIAVDITPGELTEVDRTVLRMLAMNRPKGWGITKSPRDRKEVQPSGRSIVPGFYAFVLGNYMHGEVICIWLTKTEAPITTNHTGGDYGSGSMSEYLGRADGMYVYIAKGTNTTPWPNAVADISRALGIMKN